MAVRHVLLTCGGKEVLHLQAWYALLSLLGHAPAGTRPVMVTDQPDRYRWFGDRIHLLPVDAAAVARWRGPHDFLWRAKIEAMRTAAALGPEPLLYTDTDVEFRAGLAGLGEELAAGRVFMHRREAAFAALRGRTGTPVRRHLPGRTWAGIPVTGATEMWNAGVVATADHALLDRALAVCDAILADGFHHTLVEQASFSIVLGATGRLHAADHAVLHYWGNKPGWEAGIAQVVAGIAVRGLGVDDAAQAVARNPIDRPLRVRRRWWNRWFRPLAGCG